MTIRPALTLVLTGSLAIAGCSKDSTGPEGGTLAEFIVGLQTMTGSAATLNTGGAPQAGAGAVLNVTYLGQTIVGGTSQATVTSAQPFARVVLTIDGVVGFYDLVLPSATTSTTVLVTFAQSPPRANFTTRYAGASSGSAAVGAYTDVGVQVTSVGTGDIQVSVSWDAASDVDLHLVEPTGAEIYYGNSASPNGGELDLDSNPACSIDGVNNENITYASGTPPSGTYIVRVDYYAGCGVAVTNYVVTVNVRGQTQIFTGSFSGPGDFGGAGSGVTIASFTF